MRTGYVWLYGASGYTLSVVNEKDEYETWRIRKLKAKEDEWILGFLESVYNRPADKITVPPDGTVVLVDIKAGLAFAGTVEEIVKELSKRC